MNEELKTCPFCGGEAEIYGLIKEGMVSDMSKYEYAREFCESRGFDYFEPDLELEWRKPVNSLEEKGVFFVIWEWIWENTEEDNMQYIYDNIHGYRENIYGGSFNPDDNIQLYDIEERLELSDFILNGVCVFAEITDTESKEIVGYIRLN